MNVKVILLIIAVVIAIGFGVAQFLKSKPRSSGGSTGSPSPGHCNGVGGACKVESDCCSDYTCSNNMCKVTQSVGKIPSFFLETATGAVELGDDEKLHVTTDMPVWVNGQVPESYWAWDGATNLSIVSPHKDAGGHVTSIDSKSIQVPGTPKEYVRLGDAIRTGVVLTKDGAIYTSDYNSCVTIDDTGTLMWQPCLSYPYTFTINVPTNCSTDGGCTNDSQCCPPFSSCSSGQCTACFGDPMEACPDITTVAVCANSIYSCESKCTDPARTDCLDNQMSKCVSTGGNFVQQCVWKCTGDQPTDCWDGAAQCSGSDGGVYTWQCPVNPCDQPVPDPSTAPPYTAPGYSYSNGHYENSSDPGSPWYIPYWNCHTQTWSYVPGCDSNYKQSCDGAKAACSTDTNFRWKCVDSTQYPDLCGLSVNTGDCGVDAKCLDITSCGTGVNNPSDWKWICPSNEGTPICDIIKSNQWVWPGTQIQNETVYFQNAITPLYPTVRNERCRDASASYIAGKEIRNKVNNPNALISGDTTLSITDIPASFAGHDETIYSLYNTGDPEVPQWYCASPNPCGANGTYAYDTEAYQPIVIPRSSDSIGPPTQTELLGIGKCVCDQNYGGITCERTRVDCSGAGYPNTCNSSGATCVDQEFYCNCDYGHAGTQCQVGNDYCNNHGVVSGYPMNCTCAAGFGGDTCEHGNEYCNSNGVVSGNTDATLSCACNPGFTGPLCQYGDSTTCRGNGTAHADGSCTCNSGWVGNHCSYPPDLSNPAFRVNRSCNPTDDGAGVCQWTPGSTARNGEPGKFNQIICDNNTGIGCWEDIPTTVGNCLSNGDLDPNCYLTQAAGDAAAVNGYNTEVANNPWGD